MYVSFCCFILLALICIGRANKPYGDEFGSTYYNEDIMTYNTIIQDSIKNILGHKKYISEFIFKNKSKFFDLFFKSKSC